MEDNLQNELEKLRLENEKLRNKVNKTVEKQSRKKERTKNTLTWTWKMFTGASLNKSFNNWFTEFHSGQKVSPDTSANLLTALVRRFVRVRLLSLVLLLFSLIPSLVSLYVLVKQNDLIRTQNALVEGSRKSSYGFQLSSIFDAVDRIYKSDDQGRKVLDNDVIARIIGITSSLKPYKILEEDGLSTELYSPERTQLLMFLLNANLSYRSLRSIYGSADFSYCDFRNTNLSQKYLVGVNLENSNLENCELNSSDISNANFKKANLKGVQFSNGKATGTDFTEANLSNARITKNNLTGADFTDAKTTNTNFNLSELKETKGLN
ncbi:pentapeptide repeat-containing protein [Tenacibaculum sp. IB213877]|uniref:pentapeptide repeat-containing protein n=1 Tax=Tenacibaculum sp. IB213877 TaxID=3097351 RepID=UPI002A5A2602|nr:pentapeptide repeat-containing protein [Tenacibaculum sp. IB213877]MDY0779465.1 pentapeptide repeat-containing protein [Tenacibaculum sp. IB213877]